MKILFIRHAETNVNVKKITHLTDDPAPLTGLGATQAEALVHVCGRYGVEKIFTSPEKRARETADIIAKGLGIYPQVMAEFRERNWGHWEGRPWEEIETALKPMSLDERYIFTPPGGESWQHMEARVKASLERLTGSNAGSIAIVTHEGVLRALMPIVNNASRKSSLRFHFNNGSVAVYDHHDGIFNRVEVIP